MSKIALPTSLVPRETSTLRLPTTQTEQLSTSTPASVLPCANLVTELDSSLVQLSKLLHMPPTRPEKAANIRISGKSLARLRPPPATLSGLQTQALETTLHTLLGPLSEGGYAIGSLPGNFKNWRTSDYAREAIAAPLEKNTAGNPKQMGKLAILRPGLGNIGPSAAIAFRTAQYAERVVIAYTNMTDPATAQLRAVDNYDGVAVPSELKGKIFVIGSPRHNVITFEQSSDVLLEQLEQMRQQKQLLGCDPFSSRATLIGHSQGGMDGTLTRARLEKAGFGKAIGKLVGIGSPFRGTPNVESLVGTLVKGLSGAMVTQGSAAIAALQPKYAQTVLGPTHERFVDFAVCGGMGSLPDLKWQLSWPPVTVDDHNVRWSLRLIGATGNLTELLQGAASPMTELLEILQLAKADTDGLVPLKSARYGKSTQTMRKPYDHIGLFEDAHVIDVIARHVAA